MWWRYLEARRDAPARRRYILYERALKALPVSYKLWHAYLQERQKAVRGLAITDPAVASLNNTYERALVSMHKMPRIWLEYLDFVVDQGLLTRTRRTFDRALCALPITQHDRIWQLYLKFLMRPGTPPETAVRVYKRYLRLEPTHAEEYIAYLKAQGLWGEAARKMAELVNDDTFRSLEGKSKHQLWLELCDIITKHPKDVIGLKVDAVLRSGIRKFTDEVGRLWTSLADYYIRQGMYESARDVYEEGLTTVTTVRDFSLIFDTLTQFEETLLQHKIEHGGADEDEPEQANGTDHDDGEDFLLKDDENDIDLRLARLEHLMERRPELLSSVMLRQNPHNVHEWHKRVKLFAGNANKQILTYTEAVTTVDVHKAIGKVYTLWTGFARFYERHGDLENARVIFDKATQVEFKYVDDLATVWCEWAEMELRHKNFKRALDILRRATYTPDSINRRATAEAEREGPVQGRLYRSLKLWAMYCDLEESLGTLESTRAVYDRILDLRIATPQIVLNYALFLQENKYWEESFRVYERGVSLFKYPHVRDIWLAYLQQFVQRYGGTKLERARDLFKQALSQAPPEESRPLFTQYAKLEEDYGLARSAMEVYDRAVRTVPQADRLAIYDLYLARAHEFFGLGKVREIYETAIEAEAPDGLSDEDCKKLCLRYAALERKLGEIDRARSILVHASTMADPRRDVLFWKQWNDFEVAHGNEDTFREMLRIKRSVAASFSQIHYNTTIVEAATTATTTGEEGGKRKREGDDMEALEAQVTGTNLPGFVSAGVVQPDQRAAQAGTAADDASAAPGAGAAAVSNPEDIELDEGAVEEEEAADAMENIQLETKPVPEAVYGGGGEQLGALDRFKKRKTEG
ncbi:g5126 [Coccomyxa elongata]